MGMRLGNLGLVLLVTSGIAWAEQDSHELGQISVTAGGLRPAGGRCSGFH
jgi:outer membrane receptor for ferrienterochelin and colicins